VCVCFFVGLCILSQEQWGPHFRIYHSITLNIQSHKSVRLRACVRVRVCSCVSVCMCVHRHKNNTRLHTHLRQLPETRLHTRTHTHCTLIRLLLWYVLWNFWHCFNNRRRSSVLGKVCLVVLWFLVVCCLYVVCCCLLLLCVAVCSCLLFVLYSLVIPWDLRSLLLLLCVCVC